jgi:hypothetical protein
MRVSSVMNAVRALIASGAAVDVRAVRGVTTGGRMETSLRYPEWRSVRKTCGRRDASLRSRSNRRKGAARS